MQATVAHQHAPHVRCGTPGVDAELGQHPFRGTTAVQGVGALVEPEPVAVVGGGPAAQAVAGLVHDDRQAGPGDVGGGGETGQPPTDDVDLVPRAHALSTRQPSEM